MRFGNNRNQAPRPDSATQREDFQGSCCAHLAAAPKTWLITGVAGFIGCNLLEALLVASQASVASRSSVSSVLERFNPSCYPVVSKA